MFYDEQIRVSAVYMRGGSSKALFFKEEDIPPPGQARDALLKRLMGTPDPIQIDGMGGAKAVTSKIAILARSTRENVDIDYTFAQVGVQDDTIDYSINCGNISAAVGPYAIQEGLVGSFRPGRPVDGGKIATQEIRIYNTGTQKCFISHVPVDQQGRFITKGTCQIAGVPGTGAPVLLDYRDTIGAGLDRGILPTGQSTNHVRVGDKEIEFTLCDVANIYIFANASDFNITGYEPARVLTANTTLLSSINELRGKVAEMVGMCQDWKKVDQQSPFVPMVILIAPPPTEDSDITGRLFLDNMCHESMAGTGSMAFGACSRTKDSVVFKKLHPEALLSSDLRISHPLGVMYISVEAEGESSLPTPSFRTLSFVRTARRLMDGYLYAPRETMS